MAITDKDAKKIALAVRAEIGRAHHEESEFEDLEGLVDELNELDDDRLGETIDPINEKVVRLIGSVLKIEMPYAAVPLLIQIFSDAATIEAMIEHLSVVDCDEELRENADRLRQLAVLVTALADKVDVEATAMAKRLDAEEAAQAKAASRS